MEIRKLTDADAEIFWEVRLRALRDNPEAFGSSYEEALARPIASVAARLRNEGASPDNFVLGAFEEGLVGIVGFRRDEEIKARHKGFIWGMYVVPEARGRDIGRELMRQAIARASAMPGLEQIHLSVVTVRVEARSLYLSLGFQVYGTEPEALKLGDRYLDEDLMVLKLKRET